MKVLGVKAREILDSRGNPTVECSIKSRKGISTAAVPSGASTGSHEALELRDGGRRYSGKGVQKAVKNINDTIRRRIVGKTFSSREFDEILIKLDGTHNKSRLGANAVLSASMAFHKAASLESGAPLYKYLASVFNNKKVLLPTPFMNVINGGRHANNGLAFQEFMIVPKGKSFTDTLRIGAETYHSLKSIIGKKSSVAVGDEGGFAPIVKNVREPLNLLEKAVSEGHHRSSVKFAMDSAASEFYKKGHYVVSGKRYSSQELLQLYKDLAHEYPIISIEDPFHEEDFESFSQITKELHKIQIVGDDLLVTDVARIKNALSFGACNALLLKMNQIGTVSESFDAAKVALTNRWNVMVSHRSGETEDTFIADLAVGIGCGQIKSGAPCRGERVAKYNRLLRIEEDLRGKSLLKRWF